MKRHREPVLLPIDFSAQANMTSYLALHLISELAELLDELAST